MTLFKIFRFDPEKDEAPRYEEYEVETTPSMRILDCLDYIRETYDPGLSFRYSCGHGICGSCGMTINGLAALGCQKLVKNYASLQRSKLSPLASSQLLKT